MKREDFWIFNITSNNQIKINANILTCSFLHSRFDFLDSKGVVHKAKAKARVKWKWKTKWKREGKLKWRKRKSRERKKEKRKKKNKKYKFGNLNISAFDCSYPVCKGSLGASPGSCQQGLIKLSK